MRLYVFVISTLVTAALKRLCCRRTTAGGPTSLVRPASFCARVLSWIWSLSLCLLMAACFLTTCYPLSRGGAAYVILEQPNI